MAFLTRVSLVSLALVALACAPPDPSGEEGFSTTDPSGGDPGTGDEVEDLTTTSPDESTGPGTDEGTGESSTSTTTDGSTGPDPGAAIEGQYLLAVETTLGPGLPLQYILEIEVTSIDPQGDMLADLRFSGLTLDPGALLQPRELYGEELLYLDVPITAAGEFKVEMGEIFVPGPTNPITGSDVTVELMIAGAVVDAVTLCGFVEGMLTSPLNYDLSGSTFGALRVAGTDPASLPALFPFSC